MPYEPHDLFTDPEETTLWRYMDFTKFVSLINTQTLFFPSVRTLQLIDPWEGTFMKKELAHTLKERIRLNLLSDYENIKLYSDSRKRGEDVEIDNNFISCWHYNSYESAAMWRLYLKSNEGICIQTCINSFREAFKDEQKQVYIGKVRYKDYENDIFYSDYPKDKYGLREQNSFLPFIHKRKIYEHEKEYRAIVPLFGENIDTNRVGIEVKVNLRTLIKRIILAPSSPEWFGNLVKATLEKYYLDFPVCKSEVDDKPYEFDLSPYEPKKD